MTEQWKLKQRESEFWRYRKPACGNFSGAEKILFMKFQKNLFGKKRERFFVKYLPLVVLREGGREREAD